MQNTGTDDVNIKAKEVFDRYYEEYYLNIYNHIRYLTGNIQTAEDITQETFMKLYKNPPAHTNIIGWLKKVSTNLAYNYIRDKKNRQKKDDIIYENDVEKVIFIEEAVIKDAEIRYIKKVLECLKPQERLCLLLKFSGHKYSEIAKIADVRESSVGQIIARSQQKFKKIYLKEVQQ